MKGSTANDVIWMNEALSMSMKKHDYNDIVSIETELSGYRRGSLKASIDLEAGRIAWKDTHMWNNDFVRALSPERVSYIRQKLPATELLNWATDYAKGIGHLMGSMTGSFPQDWSVVIRFSDGETLKACGISSFPKQWSAYRMLIEEIAKTSFRLR
ncbi:MAG: hypothetical protein J5379_11070 [Clostridiales bacterium]|nr:hypothetical protein [Clostridiales bacterium]